MTSKREVLFHQSWRVDHGDCIALMAAMPESSVDAIICDPPYALGFMGKEWDTIGDTGRGARARQERAAEVTPVGQGHSTSAGPFLAAGVDSLRSAGQPFETWCEAWGREALRVLRPGGYLLAFGGTRTYHRLVCGLEDAGFEIRDQVAWLYGSGFPKHESCLKPAHEPVALARKASRYSEPLQIEAARIGTDATTRTRTPDDMGLINDDGWTPTPGVNGSEAGRWPANVALDPEAAAMLDEQSGTLTSGSWDGQRNGTKTTGIYGAFDGDPEAVREGSSGGASRFFYVAKPDTAERNVGLHGRNPHPTVKPVELMRWLCRLITPKGGTVLDPFTGSGTTGIAAMREGFSFIGHEQDADYATVARARIVGDAPLINSALEAAA